MQPRPSTAAPSTPPVSGNNKTTVTAAISAATQSALKSIKIEALHNLDQSEMVGASTSASVTTVATTTAVPTASATAAASASATVAATAASAIAVAVDAAAPSPSAPSLNALSPSLTQSTVGPNTGNFATVIRHGTKRKSADDLLITIGGGGTGPNPDPNPNSSIKPMDSEAGSRFMTPPPKETVNWAQKGLQMMHWVAAGLAAHQAFNAYGPTRNEDPSTLEQVMNNMMPLAAFGLFHGFSCLIGNLFYKNAEQVRAEGNGSWCKGFSSSVGKAFASALPVAGFAAVLGVGLYFAPVSWGILTALNAYPQATVAVGGVVSIAATMGLHYGMWKEDPFVSKGEGNDVHPLQRVGQNILETVTAGMVALALDSWNLANQAFGYVMDWAFSASALATEFVFSVWANRVVGHLSQTVRPFDRMVPERDLDDYDPLLAVVARDAVQATPVTQRERERNVLTQASYVPLQPAPTCKQQTSAHAKYAGFYLGLLATVGVLGFVVDQFGGERVPSPAHMEDANLLRLMTYLTCVGATALAAFNTFRWTVMENASKTWAGLFGCNNKARSTITLSTDDDLQQPLAPSVAKLEL